MNPESQIDPSQAVAGEGFDVDLSAAGESQVEANVANYHQPASVPADPAADAAGLGGLTAAGEETGDPIIDYQAELAAFDEAYPDGVPYEETQPVAEEFTPVSDAAPQEPAEETERLRQFRLRPNNRVELRALELRAADPLLSLGEALAAAQAELNPAPAAESQPTDETPAQEVVSEADIRTQIRELRKQQAQALRDLDGELAADLVEQIAELEDRIPDVQAAARAREAQESAARAKWDAAAAASWNATAAKYPDMAVEGSAFRARVEQIDAAWGDAGDSRYDDPNKAALIGDIVAREFGVRPVTAMPQQPPARALPRPAQSPPVSSPAGLRPLNPAAAAPIRPLTGAARTAAPMNPGNRLEQEIDAIRDADDWLVLAQNLA